MSNETTHLPPPLDLSKWKAVPAVLMVIGGILSVIGGLTHRAEFGYAWLLAFMFFLTLSLGALFLVFVHHLTDAGWSVATRRVNEHIASFLFPWLAILFLPIGFLGKDIYKWMTLPSTDGSVAPKLPVFTTAGFWVTSAIFFGIWWIMTSRINYWSLRQDTKGEAICSHRMRFHSGWGIVVLSLTMTFSAVLWMQAVQHQWFSAIYGVYFFANCAWVTLATLYVLMLVLQRQRILDRVLKDHQFYFIGVLFFAFTVFQAYIEFAQYFVVWNANMPEETFWYIQREHGSWWWLSMILIFGHFFLPFFVMLPVKVKTNFKVMVPMCIWAWIMNYLDLSFNVLPKAHPGGYPVNTLWLQLGTFAFMAGFLGWIFLRKFRSCPPYPTRDPRVLEAMGVAHFEPEEMPDTLPDNGGAQ